MKEEKEKEEDIEEREDLLLKVQFSNDFRRASFAGSNLSLSLK